MKTHKGTGAAFEIIGRLKAVPTVRKTNTDRFVTNIVLAVDEVQKIENQLEHYIEWHSVTVWGNAAFFIQDYTHAGMCLKLSAKVKIEKEQVVSEEGKKYTFYVPTFHACEVEAMDRFQKTDSVM